MRDPEPMMVVPMQVANELADLRAEVAKLTDIVRPLILKAEWLSVQEAQDEYNASRSTINRWVQIGRMEAKGAGSSRRVRMVETT